jgi:CheY-like chemotaxis protein
MVPLTREDLYEKLESAKVDFGITKPIIPSVLYNGILEIFKMQVYGIYDRSSSEKKTEIFTVDHPYHVLIVEDNKTNQFIAQSILEQSGFKISLADNGQEGYDFFVQHQNDLDLILMDLHMPILNGYDAAELIRKVDADIPIMAMTADAISGVEEKCKSLGMNFYISKPFEPDQFVSTILKVLKSLQEEPLRNQNEQAAEETRINTAEAVLYDADGIARLGGNVNLYNLVLGEYYKENKGTAKTLTEKIENKNYKDAAQIVHKIKSSSGNIGAKRLYEVASQLQKALNDELISAIPKLHEDFLLLLRQLLSEIENKLPKE